MQRTGRYNRSCDAARSRFLAVTVDHVGQLLLRPLIDDLVGRQACICVHTHVDAPALLEAESSFRLVQLKGRDSEVQQDGIELREVIRPGNSGHIAEAGLDENGTWAKALKLPAGSLDRLGVQIGAQKPAVWRRGLQHGFGVTSAAQSAVQTCVAGLEIQPRDHFA